MEFIALLKLYFWGVAGAFVVELATAIRQSAKNGKCPPGYKPGFHLWCKGLMVAVCGAAPMLFDATHAAMAFYMGAAAPVMIDKMARGATRNPPIFPNGGSSSSS